MKVLMIGAGRKVRGGVSSVVDGYYDAGLHEKCSLTYLPTMEDGGKIKKLIVAAKAWIKFNMLIGKQDILHVHMSSDSSFYRKALFIRKAHKTGKKIIIHMHGSTFDLFFLERCSESQQKKVREIFGMADKVIALSEDWEKFLSENICNKEKIQIIYNAVKIQEQYDKDYGNLKILFLGKLGKRKGVYDLLEVIPGLKQKYPSLQVYLGGDGEREKAECICKETNIRDYVHFLGWVRGSEKEKYLRGCSIYVLPTYHEGMPMSVLEAMSYGMAVVSTYVGGIPNIIEHDRNGMLCHPGDTKELQLLLDDLLGNENLRQRLGMLASETIRKGFDVTVSTEKLLEIYKQLMN